MSLRSQIQTEIKKALKEKNQEKLSVLRFLHAQIKNKEIDKKREEATDEEIIGLINSQIKKLKESLELYLKSGRGDLIKKTEAEIRILSTYLPQQISDEELEKEIEAVIAQNPSVPHPGALIGICVKALAGRADNAKVARVVKAKLPDRQ